MLTHKPYGVSGIYQITNTVNKKIYIGSSIDIGRRWNNHLVELRQGKHPNAILLRSWSKHGEAAFEFSVLATCPPDYVLPAEQWFIDNLNPDYNILKVVGDGTIKRGYKMSEETKRRMSLAKRGENHSMAKLTWQVVEQIRARSGEVKSKLAKEFGVHKSTIKSILSNKTWQTVTS